MRMERWYWDANHSFRLPADGGPGASARLPAQTLEFPSWYGRNLDALYDLLTERTGPVRLLVRHREALLDGLGEYGGALCRTLEDAGTCVVPLVPWAVAGTYMASTLGVSTLAYLPWAVLCYSSFVFAIIFGFTGLTMKKADDTPLRGK